MSDEQSEADRDRSRGAVEGATGADAPVHPTTRRVRLVLGVGAVLVVGLLIGRLSSGGGDDTDAAPSTTLGAPTAVEFPSGDVNRTGYWGFVSLEPVAIDTFDRANNPESLGTTGTDQDWVSVAGIWGIDENAAYSPGGSGDGPRLAVVPDGRGDGLVEVTMTVVEDGAGLVFNYVGPENYWSVTANLGVGAWSVTRVADGEAEQIGELAAPTTDGTTISVEQKGTDLRFLLDGVEYLAIPEAATANRLQGGLVAAGNGSSDARWNRFLVMVYGDEPTTTTTAPE